MKRKERKHTYPDRRPKQHVDNIPVPVRRSNAEGLIVLSVPQVEMKVGAFHQGFDDISVAIGTSQREEGVAPAVGSVDVASVI